MVVLGSIQGPRPSNGCWRGSGDKKVGHVACTQVVAPAHNQPVELVLQVVLTNSQKHQLKSYQEEAGREQWSPHYKFH